MKNDFIKAIFNNKPQKIILVKFKNRADEIEYTRAILDDLRTDPAVEYITDGETGELLFPAV